MEIIPEKCTLVLPFAPEAISSWSDDTDLLQCLRGLFETSGIVTDEAGTEHEVYADYGKYLYQHGKRQFRAIAKEFLTRARAAKPAPAAAKKVRRIPNFCREKNFGLMAKHYLAWDAVVNAVLSESAYFSIAHVLESREELDCSVLLASHLYYKQALQVLRNFLEGVVLQLYFCDNERAFVAWKANEYKVPSFRGRDGVVKSLLSRSVISKDLADKASLLYGELNGTIHGAESRLINQGIFRGDWSGLIFSKARFEEWCKYFSRCVDLAMPIMRIHVNIWQKICSDNRTIRCDICHSTGDFDITKSDFAGRNLSTIHCRKCGHDMTMRSEALPGHGAG